MSTFRVSIFSTGTGSGKSTLALSFLRFIEFASGTIKIDDLDISSFGLDELRSRMTIIPQNAVLFSGTIRENLDPFSQHSDEELISTLHKVHIKTNADQSHLDSRWSHSSRMSESDGEAPKYYTQATTQIYLSLETEVSTGGSNLSQGTRQLVGMARALLRKSRVVIMDEASSSIE